MKKNKEWAIDEIKKERNLLNDTRCEKEVDDLTTGVLMGLKKALIILDQLEEPEVLSSDWIKDNQSMWTSTHGSEYYVPASKLYGKIVPKQEETNDDLYILKIGGGYMTDFELTGGRVSDFSIESEYGANVVMASKPFMEFVQKQVGGELHNITNPDDFAVVDIYRDIWLDGEWPSYYKMTDKEIKSLPKGESYFERFTK